MAYNSDGYIMVDFIDVDFRYTNQIIKGIYDRVHSVVGTNKFVIIINANHKTPLPSTVSFTNNKYVIESVLFTFEIGTNDNIHITKKTTPDELIDDQHITLTSTWSSSKINNELSNISIDSLSDIEDTQISNSRLYDLLFYNSNLNKWVNRYYTDIFPQFTGVLESGDTVVNITSDLILSTSKILVFTDKFGVNPVNEVVSNNTLTLTFEEQNTDINIVVVLI